MTAKPRWRTTLQTPPSPRIAVAGDAVLVTCYGPGRTDTLACFALAGGEVRWQVELEDFILGDGLGAAELVVDRDGDAAYLVQRARVASFALATGAKRFSTMVPPEEPFEAFTIAGAPVIVGSRLLLRSRRSRLVAVDRQSGALTWKTEDHESAYDVTVFDGVAITRSLEADDLRAHDLASGAPLWNRAAGGKVVELARISEEGGAYLVTEDRAVVALEPRSGAGRWRVPVNGVARAAQVGSTVVLADDGAVRGFDAATGAARWQLPGRGPAVVAPLDGTTLLVVRAAATSVVDVATGAARDHDGHDLTEYDRVLDARTGAAIVTTGGGVARLCSLDSGGGLRDQAIGEQVARPGEALPHGVLQALVTADGAVTLDADHVLARFVK